MKPLVLLNISLLILVHSEAAEQPLAARGSKRVSSEYEAAVYDLTWSKFNDWPRSKQEIRTFLWSHWKNRQLATLTVTMYTKEGDPTISRFLIKPDNRGTWHIHLYVKREIAAFLPKPRVENSEFDIYKLEKSVRRGSSRLVMKDKKGEIIGEW